MADRFTDHLASRLGISEDDARQMLAVFNGYLFEELERSGAAVIPDVGTFSRENGTTVFEADGSLASLVNARNVGLEELAGSRRDLPELDSEEDADDPVAETVDTESTEPLVEDEEVGDLGEDVPDEVLSPPDSPPLAVTGELDDVDLEDASDQTESVNFQDDETSGANAVPVDPEEDLAAVEADPSAIDDDFDRHVDRIEVTPEVIEPSLDASETDDVESAYDELHESDAVDSPQEPSDDSLTDQRRGNAEELNALIAAAYVEDESEEAEMDSALSRSEEAAQVETRDVAPRDAGMNVPPQSRPPVPPERKRSGVPWLMIGVIVIIVGVVGLFALFITSDQDEPRQPAVSEVVPPASDEFPAEAPAEDNRFDDEVADEALEDAPEPEPAPQQPAPSGDPLFGESIDRSQSRYTLVIASLPSQGAAETVMNSWRNRGFRAAVFSETIDGVTRYRVGVGQFDTIASADAARSEGNVAADLPEGTWVYRYPASTSN